LRRFSQLVSPTFASLRRHRNYRLYFSGQVFSQIGSWLQNAAQAWLILDLTHSATQVGVFGFCMYTPYAVIGLFGGAIADRFDRRRLMMVTQTAMAGAAIALAVVAATHTDQVWVIDLIGFVRGIILVFNNPARQALIVELVGRTELSNAIALNSSLNNGARIFGPAVAGLLIAQFGVAICFGINAVTFVAVLIALALMRGDELHREPHRLVRRPMLSSIRQGLDYARKTKTIAVVLTMLAVISMLAINFDVLLPVLARRTLAGGPETYGFITSIFGLGAFCGALVSASRRRASRTLLLVAAAGFGAGQLLAATQNTLAGVAVTLFLTGLCYTMYTSSTNALVQLASPGYMQGRVGGLYNYVFLVVAPLGSLIAGKLADVGSAWLVLIVGGGATLLMAAFGLAARPWPMPTGTVRPRRRRIASARALPQQRHVERHADRRRRDGGGEKVAPLDAVQQHDDRDDGHREHEAQRDLRPE
jgi:MFS family permease